MTADASHPSLGRLLVQRGVISDEQLETALRVQRDEGGMLGEILTARGWVTPLSIAAAVAKQREGGAADPHGSSSQRRATNWTPLGVLLVERGLISDVELKQALVLQRETGGFLGEILVEQGWLSPSDLVLALATQLGLDLEMRGAPGASRGETLLPRDRPAARFEVVEDVGGTARLLRTAKTFMEATDFVFDEVLWQRDPGSLEIVRVDADEREVVWTFRPGDAAAQPADDLLGVFGYAVGQWQDKHDRHSLGENGDGPSLAAAG
jgi:hypothetical protein